MTISLQGKTVLVVGGAKRIGRAVALECARSGANVVFTFHTSSEEAQETLEELRQLAPAQRFDALSLDVSQAEQWRRLEGQIRSDFGTLWGVVFCAAVFKRTPPASLSEADFDEHISSNLKGPFLGCQTVGTHLAEGGSVVLFSDIHATRPLLNFIPYCTSKAGVEMLAKGFAKALAPRGIRVNCIAPGAILPGENDEDSVEELVERVPMKRLGTVEEIAQTVLFLLNGPKYLSGVTIPVDGGQLLR